MRDVSAPLLLTSFNVHPVLQDNPSGRCRLASSILWQIPVILGLYCITLLTGCSQPDTLHSGRPSAQETARWIRRFEDPATHYATKRWLDHRLILAVGKGAPVRIAALVFDFSCYGQSARTKIYCLQNLWQVDRRLAIDLITDRIPHTNRWPVLKAEINFAVQVKNPSTRRVVTGALIKSLARRARRYTIADRPEALALRHIYHAPLGLILSRRVSNPGDVASRFAAMKVIEQWRGRAALRKLIEAYRGADPLMLHLRRYADDFAFVPRTATQLLWIEQCCRRYPPGAFASARRIFAELRPWQPSVSPLQLVWLKRLMNQKQRRLSSLFLLRQEIISCARGHRHVKRPPWYAGAPDDVHSDVHHSVTHLQYLDLWMLRYLQRMLASQEFDRQIWQQGRRAALNRSAEPGGLLAFAPRGNSGGTSARPWLVFIPSALKEGDGIYVADAAVLQSAPAAVGQFIYHFQHTDNARYCGPAIGDLQYSRHTASLVVIFTSIASRKFDVTVDFPSGPVVDLGVYHVSAEWRR
ncbi:MAG: hypothetical protein ACP5O1_10420 [Phycisphaerae bacterium]